jgi:SpoVK/Ycf46/Vps4 family AAA+-type ATPase
LQLLEKDDSVGLVVAAANHPDLLDRALIQRFDDVIDYALPDRSTAEGIVKKSLAGFETAEVDWIRVLDLAEGLSQADLSRACDEAAKSAILESSMRISTVVLVACLEEHQSANR